MLALYQSLADIALNFFNDVVTRTEFIGGTSADPNKLRLSIIDGSFLDIWLSEENYSYHWERRRQTGEIFRWDNAPHHPQINTYPKHFHKSNEQTIIESNLSSIPEYTIHEVLEFVRQQLKKND